MTALRIDPFRGFENITKRMNNFMEDIDKGVSIEYGKFSPRIDIAEDENGLYLNAEVPGLKKDDLKVSVNDENVLIIKGEKHSEHNEEDESDDKVYVRLERSFGSFQRSFLLPDNIDTESIKAKFDNGILDLSFNKKEPELPKTKEIVIE